MPSTDERRLQWQHEAARQRVRTLEIAHRSGGDIEQQLEQAKQELADVLRNVPRGHTSGFVVLCIWFAGTLTPLILAYMQLQLFFVELWQSPDHWYLHRNRPFSAHVWRWCQIFVASPWFVAIVILILAFVWIRQRRLSRRHARTFMKIVAIVETVFIVVIGYALMSLLPIPLRC